MKRDARTVRHKRVRARIHGTAEVPRLAVFKSNRHVYAQLIDDEAGVTRVHASDTADSAGTLSEKAKKVGIKIAQDAAKHNIKQVVFDRGGFPYHGVVAAVADGAREGGLIV